jgi:type IX secretion system PorP/SprF family membrane protein
MNSIRLLCIAFFVIISVHTYGQNTANFTQFFVNPYSINPSFAGIDGQNALFLAYRKQWADVENAPTTINFSYHAPLKAGLNVGFNVNNYTRSVLSTTGMQMSVAYALPVGEHKCRNRSECSY